MQGTPSASISLPFPTNWGLSTEIAGRPVLRGILTITSVSGNKVTGTANFRGAPIPINGYWDETTKQLRFETPYASFSGQLQIFDDATSKVRHLILSGQFFMKSTSSVVEGYGSWIATTDKVLIGPPIYTGTLPPVGAFLTSDLLNRPSGVR